MDIIEHLKHQREWSEKTFGPGSRVKGIIQHIKKELTEIEENPTDITEWIDIVILAMDSAWRAGYSPEQIVNALENKQIKNELIEWPDWRNFSQEESIHHIKK